MFYVALVVLFFPFIISSVWFQEYINRFKNTLHHKQLASITDVTLLTFYIRFIDHVYDYSISIITSMCQVESRITSPTVN